MQYVFGSKARQMFKLCLVSLFVTAVSSTPPYSVHRTSDEYVFKVHKSLGRLKARISESKTLHVYDESVFRQFSRKWSLPDDTDFRRATTTMEPPWFTVRIPRIKFPDFNGGEVERGTRVELPAEHICVTFDGSHPKCGQHNKCKVGEHVDSFVVTEDEVTVRMIGCKSQYQWIREAVFRSFDKDVEIEDLPGDPHKEDTDGVGWYDVLLGKERYY